MFDCGTDIRNDAYLFWLKQITSVWLIPFGSMFLCALFWWVVRLKRGKEKDHISILSAMDGFISSLMVLFYTLFPSVINHVALSFSCQKYGGVSLLTQALSVKCWETQHWMMVVLVGMPGMLLYATIIPISLALTLIYQRRHCKLYPTQSRYESKWTMRLGFVYAGYKPGFEWWESMIMARKCSFVLLSVYLRTYGAAPQVVASSLVLVLALSAHLQYRPYVNESHNYLESVGIHACLFQLLTALICNMVGTMRDENTLGPNSTVILVLLVFATTGFFFYETAVSTVRHSQEDPGCIGKLARRIQAATKRQKNKNKNKNKNSSAPTLTDGTHVGSKKSVLVVPQQQHLEPKQEIIILKLQNNIRGALIKQLTKSDSITRSPSNLRVQKSYRTKTAEDIQTNHSHHRSKALEDIQTRQQQRRTSLQARVLARKTAAQKNPATEYDENTMSSETKMAMSATDEPVELRTVDKLDSQTQKYRKLVEKVQSTVDAMAAMTGRVPDTFEAQRYTKDEAAIAVTDNTAGGEVEVGGTMKIRSPVIVAPNAESVGLEVRKIQIILRRTLKTSSRFQKLMVQLNKNTQQEGDGDASSCTCMVSKKIFLSFVKIIVMKYVKLNCNNKIDKEKHISRETLDAVWEACLASDNQEKTVLLLPSVVLENWVCLKN